MTSTRRQRRSSPPISSAISAIACFWACSAVAFAAPPHTEAEPASAYVAATHAVEAERVSLARALKEAQSPAARAAALDAAQAALHRALANEILPLWLGTPWSDRRGSSRRPGSDSAVHCGGLVVTALAGVGVRFVDEDRLGLAPALRIMEALSPRDGAIARWRGTARSKALRRLATLGDGVYLFGLAQHVGFALVEDGDVALLHASEDAGEVIREAAAQSNALRTKSTAFYLLRLTAGPGARATAATRAFAARWLGGATLGPR